MRPLEYHLVERKPGFQRMIESGGERNRLYLLLVFSRYSSPVPSKQGLTKNGPPGLRVFQGETGSLLPIARMPEKAKNSKQMRCKHGNDY